MHAVSYAFHFADPGVVRYTLSLPVTMKIQSADGLLRKRTLPQVAKSLGIPAFIAHRLKTAMQYDTGAHKALRDPAGTKCLILRDYIRQVFNTVYSALEGRQGEHRNLLQPDLS